MRRFPGSSAVERHIGRQSGEGVGDKDSTEGVGAGDTAQAPASDPLPYGESITAEQMSCESGKSGITCRDAESGAGFTISREAYALF